MKPKLIHPIDIILYRQDKTTPINPAYDEPTDGMKYLLPVRFKGQISYKVRNAFNFADGLGNAPDASGYVLCNVTDWNNLNGAVGDLVEIPGATKCKVVEVRPAAHYKGKHWFYKVFFVRGRDDNK